MQPLNYHHETGPKHSSTNDVLETGLRPGQCLCGDGGTSACWPVAGVRVTSPRSVRCILKALWRQLNVRLMARSWQNDCTIELAVMMVHITR